MKTDPNNNLELKPGLLDLIEGTRPITQGDLEELGKAIRALDDDPKYIAISLKADVITEIYHAMHEQGLTPSKLARKWGKSRQYLSKILDEDKRVNFTVDTIAEIMAVLGRRVEMHFPKKGEHTMVIHCLREEPDYAQWTGRPIKADALPNQFTPSENAGTRTKGVYPNAA